MSKAARQQVTIHYRRLEDVTGAFGKQTLEAAVRSAMNHRMDGGTVADHWKRRAWLVPPGSEDMVATFCLELGAISQYQPQPPIWKVIGILPLIFLEGLSFIAINFVYQGPVAIPVYALTGLVIAGLVRTALRLARRSL